MLKVSRLFEEEKEQAVKQAVEQTVKNMLNEGISEDVIIRIFPQLSVDDIRRIK